jgi:hypothetical protein
MSDNEQKSSRFPALQISDLIVLTLSVAFTLASIAPGYQDALRKHEINALDALPDLIGYLAIGICLFGLLVLARQRLRRESHPLSPGHWVLVVIGPYSVLALLALWIRPLIFGYAPESWRVIHRIDDVLFILILSISVVPSILAMRVLEWRWRFCFALITPWLLAMALWLALDTANTLGLWPLSSPWRSHLMAIVATFNILAGLSGLLALIVDAAKRLHRDWLHYFGIIALILDSVEVSFTWGNSAVLFWRNLYYYLVP